MELSWTKQGVILLDSGASCNFISKKFVEEGGIKIGAMGEGLAVRLADGVTKRTAGMAQDLSVRFDKFVGDVRFVSIGIGWWCWTLYWVCRGWKSTTRFWIGKRER